MKTVLLLFWQDAEKVPVVMGRVGTYLAVAYGVMQTLISIYFYYRSREVTELRRDNERARNATAVAVSELNLHKDASERKTKELTEAHQLIGELKAKTDLSAVLAMLSETISLNRESVDLSRKFDRENAQLNSSIVRALEKHGESDVEIFSSIDNSIKETSQSLKETAATLNELKMEIQEHRANAGVMIDNVLKEIRKVKPRHD